MVDIWIYVNHRDDEIEETTFGLTTEAKRLLDELNQEGRITGVALGPVSASVLETLGRYGVERVLHVNGDGMERYQGEVFAQALVGIKTITPPVC